MGQWTIEINFDTQDDLIEIIYHYCRVLFDFESIDCNAGFEVSINLVVNKVLDREDLSKMRMLSN